MTPEEKIKELNQKYGFDNPEKVETLKAGIDTYINAGSAIPVDSLDAIYDWNRWFGDYVDWCKK